MRNRSFLLLLVAGLLAASFSQSESRGQAIQVQRVQMQGVAQMQGWNIQVQRVGPAPAPSAGGSRSTGADSIAMDQARLRTALLPTDTAGLVNFFRLRARGEPFDKTLGQLIETLHAPTPAARRQACAELVALGTPALPLLRAAARNPGARDAELTQGCLKAINRDGGALTIAAVHLLAHRHPPGAAGVLLAYLPHAENEAVLQELQDALNALTYDGKGVADPAVVKALGDKHPLLRITAVVALAQGDLSPHQEKVRKLLLDPASSVRLRAALTLAQAGDSQAISTLIALLGDLADQEGREAIEEFLLDLAGELGPKVRLGEGATTPLKSRDAWAKWWRDTDGAGLLDELRKRTVSEADHDKIQALIRKLGDDNFRVREQSQAELIRRGGSVLPLLKQAVKDPDPEVRRRSDRCLASIEVAQDEFRAKLPVMARLIALRKPPRATEVILAYLPSVDEDSLIEDLQHALNVLAFEDGKPRPALLNGLSDKSWIRRAAAAQALCAAPGGGHLQTIRKLLNDPEPAVRLKVALALARRGDSAALPTLIALVAELPAEQSFEAEDYLKQLARQAGPKDLPDGEENREKRRKSWAAWWEDSKSKVVLVDSRPPRRGAFAATRMIRGYTLLVQPQGNTVTELRPDGKPHWTLAGLLQPQDAQVLTSGQRVLVAEQNRVTERDLRGKILWQKEVAQPLRVQRLHNGNTFIACNNQLLEVDRAGKEVQKITVEDIVSARKLHDGRIVALSGNQVVHFDRTGREVKRVQANAGGGCNEVLENGHVLASFPGAGQFHEYDADGKQIRQFAMPGAMNGFRLPNGHTLLLVDAAGSSKCIELDKDWKPVQETTLPAPAFRVKQR